MTDYFNNWHSIKSEWVEGLKTRKMGGGGGGGKERKMNFTNIRLKSFVQKLKSCVTARVSIKDLITKFLGLVASQRTERTFKSMRSKVPVFDTLCADEKQFYALLIPSAFKDVKQQLLKSTYIHVSEDGQVLDGLVTVTEDG